MTPPNLQAVQQAALRLAKWTRRTPIMRIEGPGARQAVIKLEGTQRSGSFKLRGALNKMMILGAAAEGGVVTASGGNHGLGVSWAGLLLGVPVHVFVPATTPQVKRDALEAANATVQVVPGTYPDADRAARAHAAAAGLPYIHAYDDPDVIAGQGTALLEFIEQAPEIRTLVVAIGGGGLASGATLAAQGRRVVGVEPFGAPTMFNALRAGKPVPLTDIESVAADSLGAGMVSDLTYRLCRTGLHRVELVEDRQIKAAQRWLWQQLRLPYEPGGAASLAALMGGRLDDDEKHIGILLCGANVDLSTLT